MKGLKRLGLLTILLLASTGYAQQLDLSDPSLMPGARQNQHKTTPPVISNPSKTPQAPSNLYYSGQPIKVTVSQTRYLPPEMYGQWTMMGTLLQTDAPDYYRPNLSEIWFLDKEGEQLVISNPGTGGSAVATVEKVEGKTASLSRFAPMGKNQIAQEKFKLRVDGDYLAGEGTYRVTFMQGNRVARQTFGTYRIEATRIGKARTEFRPEAPGNPSFEIEDVQRAPR